MAWVGSACTSACGIVVGSREWGGGLLCCVFFNAVVKGRLEFVLMFVLLSLHWFQKHKFEIDSNTLFELTLILSFNLRTIQYMCEAKIILQWSSKSLFPQTLP